MGDEDRDFTAKSKEKSEAGSDTEDLNKPMACGLGGKFLINKT